MSSKPTQELDDRPADEPDRPQTLGDEAARETQRERAVTERRVHSEGSQAGNCRGCGEKRVCCVGLFMSRARALETSDDDFEIIFAVRAQDQAGLYPGLTTYMKLPENKVWASMDSPIGRFCGPCEGSIKIPIVVEAMETGLSGEGRPEIGSEPAEMTLECTCGFDTNLVTVTFDGKWGTGQGNEDQVQLEVTARQISDGCCCRCC